MSTPIYRCTKLVFPGDDFFFFIYEIATKDVRVVSKVNDEYSLFFFCKSLVSMRETEYHTHTVPIRTPVDAGFHIVVVECGQNPFGRNSVFPFPTQIFTYIYIHKAKCTEPKYIFSVNKKGFCKISIYRRIEWTHSSILK